MIISHRHRFIFLKTNKTAGTSIEMILRPLLGPDDISTPFLPEEETAWLEPPPQNFFLEDKVPFYRKAIYQLRGRPEKLRTYGGHMRAAQVRRRVGDRVWNDYYKFAFERNPWDRQISFYLFLTQVKGWDMGFEEFMRLKKAKRCNWDVYALSGKPAANFLGRYENLEQDLAAVFARLGLGSPPELPRMKAGYRDRGRSYRDFYNEETRHKVARWYRREIAHFGYEF